MRQKCLVIAYAVHESGRREVIGLDVGEAESESFSREFLRSLCSCGLAGAGLATLHPQGQPLTPGWMASSVVVRTASRPAPPKIAWCGATRRKRLQS